MAESITAGKKDFTPVEQHFKRESKFCLQTFDKLDENQQTKLVEQLLLRMSTSQLSSVNARLQPYLHYDFISIFSKRGMNYVAQHILSFLDVESLCFSELVSRDWYSVISEGKLWKKLIETKVKTNTLWKGLAKKRSLMKFLFKLKMGLQPDNEFYKVLFFQMIEVITCVENNWKTGRYNLKRIDCRSEYSKCVYCIKYDDDKIVSGLRDNSIQIWNKDTLECTNVLTGHDGSVLCLHFDGDTIISGSSDCTIKVWSINSGLVVKTIMHHTEPVLSLRFSKGLMVTGSKDKTVAVWDIISPTKITLKKTLIGHRSAINGVDFDEKLIVSASGDRTLKMWNTSDGTFIRTLKGHERGVACLQLKDNLIVSGSSDHTIRLWDTNRGTCFRVLQAHQELVRCLRFNGTYIISGSADAEVKVWDLKAVLDPESPADKLCVTTFLEHNGRVFRLQFDDFQLITSSQDGTILIRDFLETPENIASPLVAASLGHGLDFGHDD